MKRLWWDLAQENPAFEISRNRQQIPDRLFSMLIPSPSAVFLRILGVALLEHWTMFFEFSTCHSSVHALRLVFANSFNEITHSTNKFKIILERKSVCHGFVAAGVFKRFGFEASRGWRLSLLLMLRGEILDAFRGFRWVFLNFAMRNRLPRMHQNEIHHFCNPSGVPTWRFAWDWFLAYVFTGSPPFVSRPNSRSNVSWVPQVSQEGQEELLEAPMKPSTIAFQGFWRFGCHSLLPKMEKKQCFNWGCPSKFRSSFVFVPDRFESYSKVFFLVPNFNTSPNYYQHSTNIPTF